MVWNDMNEIIISGIIAQKQMREIDYKSDAFRMRRLLCRNGSNRMRGTCTSGSVYGVESRYFCHNNFMTEKGIIMKMKNTVFVFLLSCIIFTVPAFAESPVWRISKNGNQVFLGGTLHVLSRADFPLPAAFDAAFDHSSLLVLETDIQKLQAPAFQEVILQQTRYPGEESIADFLKPDTLQALKDHLASRAIPFERMQKFKPGMLSVVLTMVELQRLGQAGTGVDEFYNLKALNEDREIKYLEAVSDQISFIAEMGEGNENEFIKFTLADLEDIAENLQSLKTAWKTGDNDQMQKIAVTPWKGRFPEIYHSLVVERNNQWIPQIEAMMKTEEVELVLFGMLHLVGEEGILSQLKKRGYKVENI